MRDAGALDEGNRIAASRVQSAEKVKDEVSEDLQSVDKVKLTRSKSVNIKNKIRLDLISSRTLVRTNKWSLYSAWAAASEGALHIDKGEDTREDQDDGAGEFRVRGKLNIRIAT